MEKGILLLLFYFLILFILIKPLGWYIAQVYQGQACGLNSTKCLGKLENLIYSVCRINPKQEMNWKRYSSALLLFNLLGMLFLYFIQRFQYFLPLNPQGFPAVSPAVAFNTAASFVTNTDWQIYSGESSLSYLTQMLGLTVQNFLSAATGMAVLVALVRGIVRQETLGLGNFWVDSVRTILYILLPLSFLFSLILVSQGVIQNFKPYEKARLTEIIKYIEPVLDAEGKIVVDEKGYPLTVNKTVTEQILPMGPVASQVAIKQLGTNGGGYFATNSAHPFENPNFISNFFEMLAILLIPAALCYTFGFLVGDKRQGRAIFIAMFILLVPCILGVIKAEQQANPFFSKLAIDQTANGLPRGNMEGKETRFGVTASAIWSALATATSNGSVNTMLDSLTPLGGLVPLWLMHLGGIVFGGVGTGLIHMFIFIIMTVFIAGLMVGRTPEYLGKKIEPFEMKMASIVILLLPFFTLTLTALTVVTYIGKQAIGNFGPHGFTEVLYAFTSMASNNGSAFLGLNGSSHIFIIISGLEMLIMRFWIFIAVLAIAGSLVRKKIVPTSAGTLITHTPVFITLLIFTSLVLGALSFLPSLALGPIVEHIMLWSKHAY
jgi:potassium-transporting ATPase potassium-binding subunit